MLPTLSFQKAFVGDNSPPLSELGSIKSSVIWEDNSIAAEAVFISTAVVAARVHSPAATIAALLVAGQGEGFIE